MGRGEEWLVGVVGGRKGEEVMGVVEGIEEEDGNGVEEVRVELWEWMGKMVGRGLGKGRGVMEGLDMEKVGCDGVEEVGMKEGWDGMEEGKDEMEEGREKGKEYMG